MPKVLEVWKVLPHGTLTQVDEGILTVTGTLKMPLMDLPRRMTVVRLSSGGLVIYSAIALDEAQMAALEAFGTPAFLVVPGQLHRLDAKIWKTRYPAMQVIAPEGARKKIAEVVSVDATEGVFQDPNVILVTVPGTGERETSLLVRRNTGTTLVLNDLVGNIRGESGFGGWLLRRAGFAGETPHIPSVVKAKLVADKAALRAQLLLWAEDSTLRRILVSHGEPIEHQPSATLRTLADTLL